jgi:ABC-2 type transport system ATP-binding protein
VLVPCYKESADLVKITVLGAVKAPLPRNTLRTVYLCDDGKVRLEDDVDALRERFRAVELVVAGDAVPPSVLPDAWADLQIRPRGVSFVDPDYDEHRSQVQCRELFPDLTRHEARAMTLREIFVALARHQRHAKEVAK